MESYPMLFPSGSSSHSMPRSGFGMEGRITKDGLQMGLWGGGTGSDDHRQTTSQERGEGVSVSVRSEEKGGSGKRKREKKVRKPRYAFQTRSHVDILDDGYRWRKYGQKSVKNNKFPRSYYRCTHQGCNVKKQVQRLTKDEAVVVTTYEGVHSHSIEKTVDNFEHILSQMQIYTPF